MFPPVSDRLSVMSTQNNNLKSHPVYRESHHYTSFNSFKALLFHPCSVYTVRMVYIELHATFAWRD
jgi:hypothetical protein